MITETIIANANHIDADNFVTPNYYMLDEDDSDRWGANAGDGCEADDSGEYRRALRAELQILADAMGKSIEIAVCDHDGNIWTADQLEPNA